MLCRPTALLALLLAGIMLAGCDRGTVEPNLTQDLRFVWVEGGIKQPPNPTKKDSGPPKKDARPADFLYKVDLPVKVGMACYYGQCGPGLICMANICSKKCTEPQPGCNAKTSECGPKWTCSWASTFSGACLEVSAMYLQACGDGKLCEQGTLCVTVGGAQAKCLRLCQYGCPKGVPCGKTNNGCSICIQ